MPRSVAPSLPAARSPPTPASATLAAPGTTPSARSSCGVRAPWGRAGSRRTDGPQQAGPSVFRPGRLVRGSRGTARLRHRACLAFPPGRGRAGRRTLAPAGRSSSSRRPGTARCGRTTPTPSTWSAGSCGLRCGSGRPGTPRGSRCRRWPGCRPGASGPTTVRRRSGPSAGSVRARFRSAGGRPGTPKSPGARDACGRGGAGPAGPAGTTCPRSPGRGCRSGLSRARRSRPCPCGGSWTSSGPTRRGPSRRTR